MSAHPFRLLALLALGGSAFAHGNHAIRLESWNGALVTGHVHGEQYHHGVRVWSAAIGGDFGLEDGYHALPVGTRVRFDLLDAARAWDGHDFDSLADGRITVTSAVGSVTSGAGPVRGFSATVQPGGIHWHLGFAFSGVVAAGPHLLAIGIDAELPSGQHLHSDPIWIVFDGGDFSDAHATALRFAEDEIAADMHFDSIAIAPASLGAVAVHVATPGASVRLLASRVLGAGAHGGIALDLESPIVLGESVALGDEALFTFAMPAELAGQELHLQAVELSTGRVSAWASLRP